MRALGCPDCAMRTSGDCGKHGDSLLFQGPYASIREERISSHSVAQVERVANGYIVKGRHHIAVFPSLHDAIEHLKAVLA